MDRKTQRDKAARRRGSMRKHQALWVQSALMGGWGVVVVLSARTTPVKTGTHHCLLFP